jgi:hypothetical protein
MTRLLLVLCALLTTGTGMTTAQSLRSRTEAYEFAAAANDARAIWVNPAGLGAVREASVMGEIALEWGLTDKTRVSQWMLGFNSQGLGFAYQRDRLINDPTTALDDSRSLDRFRLGISLPFPHGGLGGSGTMYRGGDGGTEWGWDIGLRYQLGTTITVAGVLRNIGRPVALTVPLPLGGTVGVTWLPAPSVLEVSAEIQLAERIGTSGMDALYRGGVNYSPSVEFPFTLITAFSFANSIEFNQWAIGMSFGAMARGVVVASGSIESGSMNFDQFSLAGVASRAAARPRP